MGHGRRTASYPRRPPSEGHHHPAAGILLGPASLGAFPPPAGALLVVADHFGRAARPEFLALHARLRATRICHSLMALARALSGSIKAGQELEDPEGEADRIRAWRAHLAVAMAVADRLEDSLHTALLFRHLPFP